MNELKNRYDFVVLFDVHDGNPNGDPDSGNLPRVDPETGHGLVTDVCLKRKLRNYVSLTRGDKEGYDIYVKEKAVLTEQQRLAYEKGGIKAAAEAAPAEDKGDKGEKGKGKKDEARKTRKASDGDSVQLARQQMCKMFYDVRTFGAVMSLKEFNCGQVRGPVQLTFARSIDPIIALEHSITRMAVATQREADEQGGDNRTMGRKATVPYGLYRGHGFVSPALARQTGFSDEDLQLLWNGLVEMFEHDRSAARGLMAMRKLLVFRHASELGNARAHELFDLVSVARKDPSRAARDFSDYELKIGTPPQGVELVQLPR